MMELPLDIETIPEQPEEEVRQKIAETIQPPAQMKKPETIAAWHAGEGQYAGVKDALIEERYRQTALDGTTGQICSISWAFDMDSDPDVIFSAPGEITEAEMLIHFYENVASVSKGKQIMPVGHNIRGFDLRFLYQRSVVNQVRPTFPLWFNGRQGQSFFDTMLEWCGLSKQDMITLDRLCDALGIVIPGPAEVEGSKVWDFYKDGQYADIMAYNQIDVRKVQAIYKAMHFMS